MRIPYTDLAGYLVGTILDDAAPLRIALYVDRGGRRHTRTTQDFGAKDARDAAWRLVVSFGVVVTNVYVNLFDPPWYYVQFRPDFGPDKLQSFSLPWSAYEGRFEEDD